VNWIALPWDEVQWQACVNSVVLRNSIKLRNFLVQLFTAWRRLPCWLNACYVCRQNMVLIALSFVLCVVCIWIKWQPWPFPWLNGLFSKSAVS